MKTGMGIVHGRFQLLHKEHMKYILAGKSRCEHLLIGICNPDITMTKYNEANPHRSQNDSNPFTYYERYKMIQNALLESGFLLSEFDIVPFPINYPELLCNYIPKVATHFLTIYDAWGMEKKRVLESYGYNVEVLWKCDLSEKKISGTEVRQLILDGKEWRHLVPAAVYNYVIEYNLISKICHK